MSARDELLGRKRPAAEPSLPENYGSTAHMALEAQRAGMREQDAQLEELSSGVAGVRTTAGLLSREVDAQNKLLDDLMRDVEAADEKTQAAARRVEATETSPYTVHNFCALLWPLVCLFVLLAFGLRHLLVG
jgi:hypothetical protein